MRAATKERLLAVLLLLAMLLLLLLHECPALSRRMAEEDVKDIILWQNGPDSKTVTLNREQIGEFLEHYNRAKYRGKADGSGGTAEWGAVIVQQDATEIRILDFSGGPDFEVSCDPRGWWFYLDSADLRAYILEQLEE